MKKSELLASLKSRIPELQHSDENGLSGGFTILAGGDSNVNDNGNNCTCQSNTLCNLNGSCKANNMCDSNGICSSNVTCKNNGDCHKIDNSINTDSNIGGQILAYGSML